MALLTHIFSIALMLEPAPSVGVWAVSAFLAAGISTAFGAGLCSLTARVIGR